MLSNVEYVYTKRVCELLGRSGLQLPRLPSLNTDPVKTLADMKLDCHGKTKIRRLMFVLS